MAPTPVRVGKEALASVNTIQRTWEHLHSISTVLSRYISSYYKTYNW